MTDIQRKVLSPIQYSGSVGGDFGFEINGVKSKNGYATRQLASNAMNRAVDKMLDKIFS